MRVDKDNSKRCCKRLAEQVTDGTIREIARGLQKHCCEETFLKGASAATVPRLQQFPSVETASQRPVVSLDDGACMLLDRAMTCFDGNMR